MAHFLLESSEHIPNGRLIVVESLVGASLYAFRRYKLLQQVRLTSGPTVIFGTKHPCKVLFQRPCKPGHLFDTQEARKLLPYGLYDFRLHEDFSGRAPQSEVFQPEKPITAYPRFSARMRLYVRVSSDSACSSSNFDLSSCWIKEAN